MKSHLSLFLWITLISCSVQNEIIESWDNEEASGMENDLIPPHFEEYFLRPGADLTSKHLKDVYSRMEILEEKLSKMVNTEIKLNNDNNYDIHETKCSNNRIPENCYEVNECHNNVYSIMIPKINSKPFPAVCDLKTLNGGWTIIQRRQDGSEDFFRNWTDYVKGFGNLNGEFFIGLEKLHALTTQGKPQELYIILEDFEGTRKYANYKLFNVEAESKKYKLNIGKYSGNADDSLKQHNGQIFATKDRDHNGCAQLYKGGWWYNDCYSSNLNGKYLFGKLQKSNSGQGISWNTFRGYDYSLKFVQMMIRPKQEDD